MHNSFDFASNMLGELGVENISKFLDKVADDIIKDNIEKDCVEFFVWVIPNNCVNKNSIISAFKDDKPIMKDPEYEIEAEDKWIGFDDFLYFD